MFGSTSVSSAASQYLHPDYLSPLPTTLDAKKSPLALLAQTCNSIGKDISPGRPVLKTTSSSSSSTREAKDSRSTRDSPWKVSRDHGSKVKDDAETNDRPKVISPPVEDSRSDETESTTTIQASSSSSSSGSTSRCCSDGRRSGPTPAGHGGKSSTPVASSASTASTTNNASCSSDHSRNSNSRKFTSKEKAGPRSQSARSVAATSASSPKKDSGGGCGGGGGEPEEGWLVDRSVTNSPKTDRFSSGDMRASGGSGSSSYKTDQKATRGHPAVSPGTTTTEPPFAHFRQTTSSSSPASTAEGADCLSPLVLSYLTGMPQYAGSLLPPGSMDPLTTKFPSATSLSAYLAYLQSRGGGLGPPCKDPFCTECPVAATHPLQPLPFPSMTLFDKTLTGPSLRPPYALPLHDRPCLPTGGPVSLEALSALYAAGSLAGSALSPPTALPGAWVCPWVTTDGDYCGKRCSSAEDLLVHTRGHWPSSRLSSPSPSLHSVAAAAAAGLSGWTGYHPYYPFGPSVSSMALLRHAYGGGAARNLSPAAAGLFSLGGGATGSRYHPYKSPSSTSVSLSSPSASSFDLYNNQRTMGAAAP